MKKFLTLLSLAAANVVMGQSLITEADLALLEKLKLSSPFIASGTTQMGIGSAQMLSLRGITKVGKYWYFSIYDSSLNSSFWVRLKDEDRELALIKAEFFDDENKELEISTSSYTHILALKERDALTGAVPNLPGSSSKKNAWQAQREQMSKMLSSMNNQQKAGLMGHLASSMMMQNNQQGQQQKNKSYNNNKNSNSGGRR